MENGKERIPYDGVTASVLCKEMFEIAERQGELDSGVIMTWARQPYRYWLVRHQGIKQKRKLVGTYSERFTKGYVLIRMRTDVEDATMMHLSKYTVHPETSVISTYHFHIPAAKYMSEQEGRDFLSTFDFEEKNHLDVPTAEDELEVEQALKTGILDGAEPYVFISSSHNE